MQNFKNENYDELIRLENHMTIQRLTVDRSESTFGGKAALTQEEIKKTLELAHKARKRTAW